MGPITLELEHFQVKIRQIRAEAGCSFDRDVVSSVISDSKASRNSVVFGEYRVRQGSSDVGVAIVEGHDQGGHVAVVTECRWKTKQCGLALNSFMTPVGEGGDCITISMTDMNSRKSEITTTNVWKLAADVGQSWCSFIVQTSRPATAGEVDRGSEVVDRSAEMV